MPSYAVVRPCRQCGRPFAPEVQQVTKGGGLYCSYKCRGLATTRRIIRQCAVCGGPIDRVQSKGGPYCSKSCSNRSRKLPQADRAWALVDKRGPDECWDCTCARDKDGYGLFTVDGGGQRILSRVIWELANGRTLVPGEFVLHSCDRPPCCNPAHLRPGTHADNAADRETRGRSRWHTR